jgi:hypothetical protein
LKHNTEPFVIILIKPLVISAQVTGPSRDIRIEMLARPKSVQWEERERVRRQQEEEVAHAAAAKGGLLRGCIVTCDGPQAMRQLQSANVHRNVVKPSKSSGIALELLRPL